MNRRCQARPLQFTPATVHAFDKSPSSCVLACHRPDACHQTSLLYGCPWGDCAAKAERANNLGPCSCLRAWIRLCLLSLACTRALNLHLTPPNVYLCALSPIPGGPHCHMLVVRPSSHGSAPTSQAYTVGPSPCCLPWSPPLHVCLQLPPATAGASSEPPKLPVCIDPATTAACPGP